MKKVTAKMSTRLPREMDKALRLEMLRDEAQQLESERVAFEHGARLARQNLYGLVRREPARGWVDARRK